MKRTVTVWLIAATLGLLAIAAPAPAGEGATTSAPPRELQVELSGDGMTLRLLARLQFDVDAVFGNRARVYTTEEGERKLAQLGIPFQRVPFTGARRVAAMRRNPATGPAKGGGVPPNYHTYETLVSELAQVAADHPEIVRLMSIGQTVQGRELWMIKISDNPDVDEDEPEVAYLSSMHGDEVVGKELCIGLIHHLTDNYPSNARVADLVDGTEIWILPSLNPDGTAGGQRWNQNGVDLNRDFPDQFADPNNSGVGREPETVAVMNWASQRTINLAANLHGGALVVNYPFDGNPTESNVHSPSPDQALFVSLSRTYADANGPMSTSNGHSAFHNGITNGADWFAITGGMQDWNYVWNGALEVTLEVGNTKWPSASALPGYWSDNLESMLAYLERVHEGLRGVVTDAETGAPVPARVGFGASAVAARTDPDVGDYHRPLLPGSYDVHVEAVGYEQQLLQDVVVLAGAAVRRDVALTPLATDLQPQSAEVLGDDGADGRLDPGESADLAVTLRNFGGSAGSIAATLEPTGWYGDVPRAGAGFPDLAPGASGVSDAPHFGVELAADTPAGHKAGFVLRWQTDRGAGVSDPFFVATGGATCASFSAIDIPLQILDQQTITSEIAVPLLLELTEVRVTVDIVHTYIADLTVSLEGPDGKVVTLHENGGGDADDIQGTYGDDLLPVESLSAFADVIAAGDWSLAVHDGFPADTGWLNGWSVELCGVAQEARPPEMRLRDVSRVGGGVDLTWWPYPGLTGYRVYRSNDPTSAASFVDVTAADSDPADTRFLDPVPGAVAFYLVTGESGQGEGLKGHFGE